MTTPLPEPDNTTPDLNTLETQTRARLDQHLKPARREAERPAHTPADTARRNNRVLQRLRQARAAITETATRATHQALTLGAQGAATEAPPPPGNTQPTTPDQPTTQTLTADIDLREDIRYIITNQGIRIETGPPQPNQPTTLERIIQTAERLWNTITTRIHDAFNRGRRWYAQLFNYELRWYTRTDERVCPTCRPLNGHTIASTQGFEPTTPTEWPGTPHQPPAHYRCRCYTQVIQTGPIQRALRRTPT